MNDSVHFNTDSELAVPAVTGLLQQRGFRILRSFDLRSALAAHADCTCPHHGTTLCNCQFIVLLVYGRDGEPVVVTAHGHDAQTYMGIVYDTASQPDRHLYQAVIAILQEAARAFPAVPVEQV